jgi:hypothetical protein
MISIRNFISTSLEFNSIECGFDGGDCCPVGEDDRYGDGVCDGFIFNTEVRFLFVL